VTVILYRSS